MILALFKHHTTKDEYNDGKKRLKRYVSKRLQNIMTVSD